MTDEWVAEYVVEFSSPLRRSRHRRLARILRTIAISLFLAAAVAPGWAAAGQLVVSGEPAGNGIFDPSIEVDPISGEAWMAYSAVYGTELPWGPHVETHLAKSVVGGATWNCVGIANISTAGQIMLDGDLVDGFWNREVPSLVYDATDVGKEWKLFNHYIFRRTSTPTEQGHTVPAFSWLELHEAASPTGPWTRIVKLGSGPLPPAGYPIDQALNLLDGSLSGTYVYSEPGLCVLGSKLYVSLSALSEGPVGVYRSDVILLSSANHGATWGWEGQLITQTDASALGFVDFGGTAIVEEAGRVFLLASPGTPTISRNGVGIFEFSDLTMASLYTSPLGEPMMFDHLTLAPAPGGVLFGGQAEFHEFAAAGGIMMNQLETALWPEVFQITETNVSPVPEPAWGTAVVWAFAALCGLGRRRLGCSSN